MGARYDQRVVGWVRASVRPKTPISIHLSLNCNSLPESAAIDPDNFTAAVSLPQTLSVPRECSFIRCSPFPTRPLCEQWPEVKMLSSAFRVEFAANMRVFYAREVLRSFLCWFFCALFVFRSFKSLPWLRVDRRAASLPSIDPTRDATRSDALKKYMNVSLFPPLFYFGIGGTRCRSTILQLTDIFVLFCFVSFFSLQHEFD